ncbi:MAG: undecaprenyl-phosphate alpha-N-acetylglucosaminyl 1-phosphate transferase [Cyanobacteria bacterium QS_8_64_29]|nr:MAG: undecaprenyl-phosphate alpha-N-acetylglucosaminyl 1-phosphate transferase [Cyanobacteria bacterium QS_8_64_29]
MSGPLYSVLAFAVAAGVVWVVTPLLQTLGLRSGNVDRPDERKHHQNQTVNLGGIAIFGGVLAAFLLLWGAGAFEDLAPATEGQVWVLLVGGTAFFVVGLIDDLRSLPAMLRLAIQMAIAVLVWTMGIEVRFVSVLLESIAGTNLSLDWVNLPVTAIWLVGMANAINWMDGLDGLAAGMSGIAAAVMAAATAVTAEPASAPVGLALAGSSLGFLRYNFHPSQIFMGDSGSYFLGFTLAALAAIGLVQTNVLSAVAIPFLVLAVPIGDMSAVIGMRLLRGHSPLKPDRRHLHHRLLAAGVSQRAIAILIYSLTAWVGALALLLVGTPGGVACVLGATGLLAYASWHARRQARSRHRAD